MSIDLAKLKILLLMLLIFAIASCNSNERVLHGYVEGEYVYISPTTSGILAKLTVKRGQFVKQGEELFLLDATELQAKIIAAQADVARSEAVLKNLLKGKRSEEIEVIEKQRQQAKVVFENAQQEFKRADKLLPLGAISPSEYDKRKMDYKSAYANVEVLESQLKVALLGARKDEISAAKAELEIVRQKLIQIKKQANDAMPAAPIDSYVENTLYNQGEFVPSGKAVVSLLPLQNIKVRFFVLQRQLPNIHLGQKIRIKCDGCQQSIAAKVSFISSRAEYTPPVIYSTASREKLVYMVEAHPISNNMLLRPGLPVDIVVELP